MGGWGLKAGLAVSSLSCIGAGESPQAPTCPAGYFRKDQVVAGCGSQFSELRVLLSTSSCSKSLKAEEDLTIPQGAQDFRLKAEVLPVSLALAQSSPPPPPPNIKMSLKERLSGAGVGSSIEGSGEASVALSGTLSSPADLIVCLETGSSSSSSFREEERVVLFSYRYDALQGCSEIPLGCSKYNGREARDLVLGWNDWVMTKYPDGQGSWDNIWMDSCPKAPGLAVGPIPFFLFKRVWSLWPSSSKSPGWQAAFHFMDGLVTQDGAVSKEEWTRALKMAGAWLSLYTWCLQLRKDYGTVAAAWTGFGGSEKGLGKQMWEALWASFQPPASFSKADVHDVFTFLDFTQDGTLSLDEFQDIFAACPSTSGTSAAEATDPKAEQQCCEELTAQCLACQAQLSLWDFCSQEAFRTFRGCEAVPSPTPTQQPRTPKEESRAKADDVSSTRPASPSLEARESSEDEAIRTKDLVHILTMPKVWLVISVSVLGFIVLTLSIFGRVPKWLVTGDCAMQPPPGYEAVESKDVEEQSLAPLPRVQSHERKPSPRFVEDLDRGESSYKSSARGSMSPAATALAASSRGRMGRAARNHRLRFPS